MARTCWKSEIAGLAGDDVIIHHTLTEEELLVEFDDGFGTHEGKPFTAWSEKYVYFPTEYDGAEGVARVSRNPCDIPTEHV